MLSVIDNKKVAISQHQRVYVIDNVDKLAELITNRLNALGMKKAELARKVGISRSYIVNMANGTAPTKTGQYQPGPEVVSKIAKALEIEEQEILGAMDYLPEEDESITAELDDDVKLKLLGGKHYTDQEKQEFLKDFQYVYEIAKKRIADKRKRM